MLSLLDSVTAFLTDQLTDQLHDMLGQRFAQAHLHLDLIGLNDLIDQALRGFPHAKISETLRSEIRWGEANRYNNLVLVTYDQAFKEAMKLASCL